MIIKLHKSIYTAQVSFLFGYFKYTNNILCGIDPDLNLMLEYYSFRIRTLNKYDNAIAGSRLKSHMFIIQY